MAWHNVVITEPARLSVKHQQLLVEQTDKKLSIPLEDITSITLESQQCTLTSALLSHCAQYQILLISCDEKHLPNGQLLTCSQHSRELNALHLQINTKIPFKKRLWQKIIKQKITNQAELLKYYQKNNVQRLLRLAKETQSGDPNNHEATAARLYFSSLFESFKRHNNDNLNTALNYGYSLVRALLAREISSFGLQPALGIHHCSELNNFNLADDLIEPFRPIIDSWILQRFTNLEQDNLSKEDRGYITQIFQLEIKIENEKHSLQYAAHLTVKSFISSLKLKQTNILLAQPLLPTQLKKLN